MLRIQIALINYILKCFKSLIIRSKRVLSKQSFAHKVSCPRACISRDDISAPADECRFQRATDCLLLADHYVPSVGGYKCCRFTVLKTDISMSMFILCLQYYTRTEDTVSWALKRKIMQSHFICFGRQLIILFLFMILTNNLVRNTTYLKNPIATTIDIFYS